MVWLDHCTCFLTGRHTSIAHTCKMHQAILLHTVEMTAIQNQVPLDVFASQHNIDVSTQTCSCWYDAHLQAVLPATLEALTCIF